MNHDVDQSRHQNRPSRQRTANRRRSRVHVADADLVEVSPQGSPTGRLPPGSPFPSGNPRLARTIALHKRRGPLGSMPVFMTRGKRGSHERQVCGLPAAGDQCRHPPAHRWHSTMVRDGRGNQRWRAAVSECRSDDADAHQASMHSAGESAHGNVEPAAMTGSRDQRASSLLGAQPSGRHVVRPLRSRVCRSGRTFPAPRRHPTRRSPLRKPLAVIVHHRDDVGRLTLDRDVAWPRQRRPPVFAGHAEGFAVSPVQVCRGSPVTMLVMVMFMGPRLVLGVPRSSVMVSAVVARMRSASWCSSVP